MEPGVPGDEGLARAPRALALSFANGVVGRLGTLAIGIALARVVGPEEFGTYAVALVALMAALSFNELGVSLAIVRWPEDPKHIAPTVNTISLIASLIVAGTAFLVAPVYSAAMGAPDATPVVQVLALSVLVSGTVATPAALMQRRFMQEKRVIVDQTNMWVGAIASIVLAIVGLGAMSLAVGRLLGSACAMVLFIRFSPEPFRLGFDRTKARALLAFGVPLAGASIIVFFVGFADQIVAGHVLGATALGFYLLAFNLSSWPRDMFSLPMRQIAPPTFARLQHQPEAMRSAFRDIAGVVAAVTFPVCLLLSGAAEPLIRFVYGEQWVPAAAALVWLGILTAFKILFELAYDYLVVVGISRSILGLQAITLVALVPALYLGSQEFGIAGTAAAQVVVAATVALPLYLVLFHRAGVPAPRLLGRLWLPGLIAGGVALAAMGLADVVPSDIVAIFLAGLVALAALAGLVWRNRTELQRLRGASLAQAAAGKVEVAA
jgi:O-antigen/teichoic acid export membrane protein